MLSVEKYMSPHIFFRQFYCLIFLLFTHSREKWQKIMFSMRLRVKKVQILSIIFFRGNRSFCGPESQFDKPYISSKKWSTPEIRMTTSSPIDHSKIIHLKSRKKNLPVGPRHNQQNYVYRPRQWRLRRHTPHNVTRELRELHITLCSPTHAKFLANSVNKFATRFTPEFPLNHQIFPS